MKLKFLGTEIYVSFLFCAVVCLMLLLDRTGLIIPTFFAIFIHESGHLFAMWVSGCQPKAVRLIPTSVQIVREFSCKRDKEIAIAICGPAANAVVFITLMINYYGFKGQHSLRFAILNLVMAIFNMMPVTGLDGGTILTECLSKFTDVYKAESIVRVVTVVFAVVAFLAGVYLWVTDSLNLSVFIVAAYLIVCVIIKK